MKAVVVGAGVIGLSTAYFLRQQGAEVTVLEREAGPGLGTSFANGALLHPSLVEPWNAPGVLGFLLRHLGRDDSPMLLRLRALPSLAGWGLRFLRESDSERFQNNTRRNLALARHSLAQMKRLRDETGLRYHGYARGSLSVYRSAPALKAAREAASGHGIGFDALDRDGLVAAEPMLAAVAPVLKGGLHYRDDEGGDAYAYCTELAAWLTQHGVAMHAGCKVTGFERQGRTLSAVLTDGAATVQRHAADVVVLCAGVWSPELARPLGLRLPMRPAKGYSITVPLPEGLTPRVPVVDHDLHAAVVPVGADRLRVAGTAEFTGMDRSLTPARVANLRRLLRQVYPAIDERTPEGQVSAWAGLRPMCADGVPLIGPTRWGNLFLNTGHGHLGWTLAAGSGQMLADLVAGHTPAVDPRDYAAGRA